MRFSSHAFDRPGVYELKEYDDATWYRVMYLAKVEDTIYVLHCFEKNTAKTTKSDLRAAKARLTLANQRIQQTNKSKVTAMTNRASKTGHYVTHTTTGDVLDDLGFSPEELPALKLRADALSCILDEIAAKNYSAKQLEKLLDEYQPQVSNLMRGKIAKLSLEKLLYYCARLGIQITTKFKPQSKLKRESQMNEVMKAFGVSSARTPPPRLSAARERAMAAKKRITISRIPVRGFAAARKPKRTSKPSRIAARSK